MIRGTGMNKNIFTEEQKKHSRYIDIEIGLLCRTYLVHSERKSLEEERDEIVSFLRTKKYW